MTHDTGADAEADAGADTGAYAGVDEATINEIAHRSYLTSKNLSTREYPWENLSENNKDRVREVIRDVLTAMDELGLVVTVPQADEADEGSPGQ